MKKKKPEIPEDKPTNNIGDGAVPFDLSDFEKKYGHVEEDVEDEEDHEHEHTPEGQCIREEVVVRSVPMSVPQKIAWGELQACKKEAVKLGFQAKKIMFKVGAKHRKFWSTVEDEIAIYGQMRVNTETMEVEVMK